MSEQNVVSVVAVETDKAFPAKCKDCVGRDVYSEECFILPACSEKYNSGKNMIFKLNGGDK